MEITKGISVEVFKTSLDSYAASSQLIKVLLVLYPEAHVNVDLDDCDKILRIEAANISVDLVSNIVMALGHECSLLT